MCVVVYVYLCPSVCLVCFVLWYSICIAVVLVSCLYGCLPLCLGLWYYIICIHVRCIVHCFLYLFIIFVHRVAVQLYLLIVCDMRVWSLPTVNACSLYDDSALFVCHSRIYLFVVWCCISHLLYVRMPVFISWMARRLPVYLSYCGFACLSFVCIIFMIICMCFALVRVAF